MATLPTLEQIQKATVYQQITASEGGIAGMSHTNAKKILFNMSEKEIIDDLQKQRMERAISQELQDSPLVIRETGLFKDIDDKYGTGEAPVAGAEAGAELEAGEGAPEANVPPAGGADAGAAPQSPEQLPPVIGQGQGFKDTRPQMNEDDYNDLVNKLVSGDKKEKEDKSPLKQVIKENDKKKKKIKTKMDVMTEEIDVILQKSDDFINNNGDSLDKRNFQLMENYVKDLEVEEKEEDTEVKEEKETKD